jgi:arachidonate 5-lipoxygenase
MVNEFYSTDEDVENDTEIQDWTRDVYTDAFPGWFGAKESDRHGFPKQIATKKVLTEYCTLIIFTGSVQHASINFGQYDMYAFVPNAPATLRLPPPSKKGDADYNTLMSTLPDKANTANQIAVAHLLSQYSDDEVSTYSIIFWLAII